MGLLPCTTVGWCSIVRSFRVFAYNLVHGVWSRAITNIPSPTTTNWSSHRIRLLLFQRKFSIALNALDHWRRNNGDRLTCTNDGVAGVVSSASIRSNNAAFERPSSPYSFCLNISNSLNIMPEGWLFSLSILAIGDSISLSPSHLVKTPMLVRRLLLALRSNVKLKAKLRRCGIEPRRKFLSSLSQDPDFQILWR